MKYLLLLPILLLTALNATPMIKIEAQELLKHLAYKEGSPYAKLYDWDIGTKEMSPIEWDPDGNNWTPKGFERKGKVYLANNGKITHNIVDDTGKKPGFWDLYLLGNKDKIIQATLAPNKATLENPSIVIDKAFIQKRVVCQENDTKRVVALKVRFPQSVPMWIEEDTDIDTTKGNKSIYTISFENKPKCLQEAQPAQSDHTPKSNTVEQNTKEQIKQFIQSFYKIGESPFPAKALKFYDSRVDLYFGRKNLDKEEILEDKIRYYRRWPKREYTLKDIEIIDTFVKDTKRYYTLNTVVDWSVTSAKGKNKTGTAYNIIKLIETGNGYLVKSIKSIGNETAHKNKPKQTQAHTTDLTRPAHHTDRSSTTSSITFEESGISIVLTYPKYIEAGTYFKLKAVMTNNFTTAKQGGLTLSFPDLTGAKGRILSDNFTSLKAYTFPDKIYNKTIRGAMKADYLMVEGWQSKKWRYGRSKYFEIALKAPYRLDHLRVNVRGILWRRGSRDTIEIPRSGNAIDQQGFAVKQLYIPIEK